MWLSRNPVLLRQMLTNFDALFSISNALMAVLCVGVSFGFDERAVALLLVPFPYFAFAVLGDASMADMDFKLRPFAFGFGGLLFILGIA